MSDITVTHWERDGLHRGYANAPDGTVLGWVDVATGEVSLNAPATRIESTESALRTWARETFTQQLSELPA